MRSDQQGYGSGHPTKPNSPGPGPVTKVRPKVEEVAAPATGAADQAGAISAPSPTWEARRITKTVLIGAANRWSQVRPMLLCRTVFLLAVRFKAHCGHVAAMLQLGTVREIGEKIWDETPVRTAGPFTICRASLLLDRGIALAGCERPRDAPVVTPVVSVVFR
jgi:hypothetical protein